MGERAEELQDEYRMQLLHRMEKLADGRVNDAVKLAFLDGEQMDEIDRLDLTALTEFKRSGSGTVEFKLINRLAVLEKLLDLLGGGGDRADAFFRALDDHSETGSPIAGGAIAGSLVAGGSTAGSLADGRSEGGGSSGV